MDSALLDSFIHDDKIKRNMQSCNSVQPIHVETVNLIIRSDKALNDLKKDEQWLVLVFLNNDSTRKLILKERIQQTTEILYTKIDCNVNANYLKYFKTGMVLLYATKMNDSSQASSFPIDTCALEWGAGPVICNNSVYSCEIIVHKPPEASDPSNPIGCYLHSEDFIDFNYDESLFIDSKDPLASSVFAALMASCCMDSDQETGDASPSESVPDLFLQTNGTKEDTEQNSEQNSEQNFEMFLDMVKANLPKFNISSGMQERARAFYENKYMLQALKAFEEQQYQKCLNWCQFVRTINDSNIQARNLSIRCLLEKKCIQEAYIELSKGVDTLEQLYLLGDVYLKMGYLSKAKQLYDYISKLYDSDAAEKVKLCYQTESLWNSGKKEYERKAFENAWTAFDQVLKVCSNNRQVVTYYLESVLRSNDRSLLASGMKLLKGILNNAAKYIYSTTYGTIYNDGTSQDGDFQSEQLFSQNLLLQITMDLYDVNVNEVENWKNKVNDDFTMLFLRFLCQNNETTSFLNLCNAIEHCNHIPPDFHEFSRLMRMIISLYEEGEKFRLRKMQQESILTYQQALHLIDIFEATFPFIKISYMRSLLCYFCADMQYYRNRYHEAISFCCQGLRCQPNTPILFVRRARTYQRANRMIPALIDFYDYMKNTKEAERIESEMRNCIKNLNAAKMDFLAVRCTLLEYYRNPSNVYYVNELELEFSRILSSYLLKYPYYPYYYLELAILAFRRADWISFIGYMRRFKEIMNLPEIDDPECHHPPEIPLRSEPMTVEEVKNMYSQGCTDSAVIEALSELDNIQSTDVFLTEKGKHGLFSASHDCCTSLVVLEMLAYYFYWSLALLLAGNFSAASRFANYSDRVYRFIVSTFPQDLPPRNAHATIVGKITDFVSYTKKTFDIGRSLQLRERFEDYQNALLRVFAKAPYGVVMQQIHQSGSIKDFAEMGITKVVPIDFPIQIDSIPEPIEYNYPQLNIPTIAPFLLCRSVLLNLCSSYLKANQFTDGVSFLKNVYPNLLADNTDIKVPRNMLFAMQGQLMTSTLDTVYTDTYIDSQLMLYLIKFLLLSDQFQKANLIFSLLPLGIQYEPDFLVLNVFLSALGSDLVNDNSKNWREIIHNYQLGNPENCNLIKSISKEFDDKTPSLSEEDAALLSEGKRSMYRQEFEKAGSIFRDIAKKHAYSASFAEDIAVCEMNTNSYYNAIGELKMIIIEAPHHVRAFYLLSRAYSDIGNLQMSHQYYQYYVYLVEHVEVDVSREPGLYNVDVERRFQSVDLKDIPAAIPIIKEYIAMCPYCREAYIKLLHCYYVQSDLVAMKQLLTKLMGNLDEVVSALIEDSLSNAPPQMTIDRSRMMMPTLCKVDENVTPIICDNEMFFYYIRYLFLRNDIPIAKTLLNCIRKGMNVYFSESKPENVSNVLNMFRDTERYKQEIIQLSLDLVKRGEMNENMDFEGGLHPLDNSYRLHPFYMLAKAANNTITEITKRYQDGQSDEKMKATNGASMYTDLLMYINARFFFNEDINLRFVRARLLFERAKRRMEISDVKNASADSSEALNYDSSILECYLLKARTENMKKEYFLAISYYKTFISRGKLSPEISDAIKEYEEIKNMLQFDDTDILFVCY